MAEIKFDQSLQKLEEIVRRMEGGELSLEAALKDYEEGVKLASVCLKKLAAAENRIEVLKKDAAGVLRAEPFAPGEAGGPGEEES
jgi:exodeoxyribonuclease VII small subunit